MMKVKAAGAASAPETDQLLTDVAALLDGSAATLAEVNKAYGKGTLVTLSKQPELKRLPTGSFDLDVALGGGWPMGRISLIWGPRSSGKSTLTAHAIRQAQEMCRHDGLPLGDPSVAGNSQLPLEPEFVNKKGVVIPKEEAIVYEEVVNDDMSTTTVARIADGVTASPYQQPMRTLLVNQEGALDVDWVANIGVNPELVYCLTTDTAEQTIDITDKLMRDGLVDLVVLDSLAAMVPSTEAEETTEKWQQGLQARLINKALRIWVGTINSFRDAPMRPTMLLINQVRTKIGVMYGSPDVKPGGVGQDFATSCEVKIAAGSVDKKTDLAPEDEGGHMVIARTNFKVTKNKTYASGSVGQYLVATVPQEGNLPGMILDTKTVIDRAKQYGILTKDKTNWVLGGVRTFPTLKAIVEWADAEPEEFESFKRGMVEALVSARAGRK